MVKQWQMVKHLLRWNSLEEQVRIGRTRGSWWVGLSMWNLCIQLELFGSKYGAQERGEVGSLESLEYGQWLKPWMWMKSSNKTRGQDNESRWREDSLHLRSSCRKENKYYKYHMTWKIIIGFAKLYSYGGATYTHSVPWVEILGIHSIHRHAKGW